MFNFHFRHTVFTLLVLCCFPLFRAKAQNDTLRFFQRSPVFNKKRLIFVSSTEATIYLGSMIGLNEAWYKNYPRSSFHFFNDDNEWLQMDKVGHMTSAYYIGRLGINALKWSGVADKKAIWYGGCVGLLYQSTIEVLDGFSKEWGFSPGDMTANTLGTALVIGQELAWDEQRMVLKESFHQTKYEKYRPEELGSTLSENILKDYNGQTLWLSINLASFMPSQSTFPKWMNLAVGYGAEGMTGGTANPPYIDKYGNPVVFDRYRQFYLALDADLTKIKTRSAFLKSFFRTFGFIKIPAPAVEFSKHGTVFSALYF